jgi:hypothetical protein
VGLAGSLPEDKSRAFYESDVRLRIETIKARLRGRPGLREDVERYGLRPEHQAEEPPVRVTPKRVRDTLGYIRNLSGYHPDHRIADAMRVRLGALMDHIK